MQAGRELGDRQSQLLDMTMGLLKASYPVELWDNLDWRMQNKDNLRTAFRDIIRTFSVTPNEEASLLQAFDSLLFGKTAIPEETKKSEPLIPPYEVPEGAMLPGKEAGKIVKERQTQVDVPHKLFEMLKAIDKLKKQEGSKRYQGLFDEIQKVRVKPNKTADDVARINQLYEMLMKIVGKFNLR